MEHHLHCSCIDWIISSRPKCGPLYVVYVKHNAQIALNSKTHQTGQDGTLLAAPTVKCLACPAVIRP